MYIYRWDRKKPAVLWVGPDVAIHLQQDRHGRISVGVDAPKTKAIRVALRSKDTGQDQIEEEEGD